MSATTPAFFRLVARLERNPEATAAVRATLLKSGADLHLFRCSGSDPRFVELHAEISLSKPRRLPSVLHALEALRRVAVIEADEALHSSWRAGRHHRRM